MSIILGIIHAVQAKTTLENAHLFSLFGGVKNGQSRQIGNI
jgi:hypothetical protein